MMIEYASELDLRISFGHVRYLMPHMIMDQQEAERRRRILSVRALEIVGNMMHMEPLEREIRILDWLAQNIVWEKRNDILSDHTAWGILMDGRGVCDGISSAVSILMNTAGIDCCTVSYGSHAWNVVRIGEKTAHLDAGTICFSKPGRPRMVNVGDDESYHSFGVTGV